MRTCKVGIHHTIKTGLLVCALVVLTGLQSVTAVAQTRRRDRRAALSSTPPPPGLWHKSIIGGQLGPWFTDDLGKRITDDGYDLSASSTAFHLELFFQMPLVSTLYLDLNFGSVSRGDIRILYDVPGANASSIGDATLYPIGVGLQWVPFAKSVHRKFQPLVRAGGSLIVGTERLETVLQNQIGYIVGFESNSRVDVGFYAGAGALLVLGRQFTLRGETKYQHAKFSKELFGVRDYSGIQVLFGAAYLYH